MSPAGTRARPAIADKPASREIKNLPADVAMVAVRATPTAVEAARKVVAAEIEGAEKRVGEDSNAN